MARWLCSQKLSNTNELMIFPLGKRIVGVWPSDFKMGHSWWSNERQVNYLGQRLFGGAKIARDTAEATCGIELNVRVRDSTIGIMAADFDWVREKQRTWGERERSSHERGVQMTAYVQEHFRKLFANFSFLFGLFHLKGCEWFKKACFK